MTPSNNDIILLLSSGYTVKEIAAMLNMRFWTVKKRIRTMMKNTESRTVTHLVVNQLKLNGEKVQTFY